MQTWIIALGKYIGNSILNKLSNELLKKVNIFDFKIFNKKKYSNVCNEINKILYENNKIFIENNPFLDKNSTGIVEMDSWYTIQETIINPNNLKILSQIQTIEKFIPSEKKELFQKIKQHIYMFDNHIKDRTKDYSKFQFPKDFSNYIASLTSKLFEKHYKKYLNWLNKNIRKNNIPIKKIYCYGSMLFEKANNISDVDIIFYVDSEKNDLNKIKLQKDLLMNGFEKKFKKRLHLLVFVKSENEDLLEFLNKLYFYKEF